MLSHPQPEKAGPRAAWEELSALSREPSLLSAGCGRSSWGHLRGVGGTGRLATPGKGVQKLDLRPTRDTLGHGDVAPPQVMALPVSVSPTQPGPGLARNIWGSFPPGQTRASEGQNLRTSLVVQRLRPRAPRSWRLGLIPGQETGCHMPPLKSPHVRAKDPACCNNNRKGPTSRSEDRRSCRLH